jgi:lipopolysaccharide transport system ATP-binding protein
MNPIIRVDHLSKKYRIGTRDVAYETFREALGKAAVASWRRIKGEKRSTDDFIWALDDVSFKVMPGEVIGLIGRNGAGKSTLLKILSRITEPTHGEVELVGRLSSLLEVGTGFHSELTGRENIYLNGAILGMKHREIDRKFDEIVSFAEIGPFLETPVKRYSSGMALRLAFAVAAHLEPDILMVDEVLAVGDAQFQRKCLAQMNRVSRQGRTVVFVSHQLRAVEMFCTRVIHIDSGKIVNDGNPKDVVHQYLSGGSNPLKPVREWPDPARAPGNHQFRLRAMRVLDSGGEPRSSFYSSRPILIEMEFDLSFVHSAFKIGFELINEEGVVLFRSEHTDRGEQDWPILKLGRNKLQCQIPAALLNFGTYSVSPKATLHSITTILNGDPEIAFDVQLDHSESPLWSTERSADFPGVIAPCLPWKVAP